MMQHGDIEFLNNFPFDDNCIFDLESIKIPQSINDTGDEFSSSDEVLSYFKGCWDGDAIACSPSNNKPDATVSVSSPGPIFSDYPKDIDVNMLETVHTVKLEKDSSEPRALASGLSEFKGSSPVPYSTGRKPSFQPGLCKNKEEAGPSGDCSDTYIIPEEVLRRSSPSIPEDERVCRNCWISQTPLWRRNEEGCFLCNACGLYQKTYGKARPFHERQLPIKKKICRQSGQIKCHNCFTTETSLWRRGPGVQGPETYCNACGLYWRIHNAPRPLKPGAIPPLKRRHREWKRPDNRPDDRKEVSVPDHSSAPEPSARAKSPSLQSCSSPPSLASLGSPTFTGQSDDDLMHTGPSPSLTNMQSNSIPSQMPFPPESITSKNTQQLLSAPFDANACSLQRPPTTAMLGSQGTAFITPPLLFNPYNDVIATQLLDPQCRGSLIAGGPFPPALTTVAAAATSNSREIDSAMGPMVESPNQIKDQLIMDESNAQHFIGEFISMAYMQPQPLYMQQQLSLPAGSSHNPPPTSNTFTPDPCTQSYLIQTQQQQPKLAIHKPQIAALWPHMTASLITPTRSRTVKSPPKCMLKKSYNIIQHKFNRSLTKHIKTLPPRKILAKCAPIAGSIC